MPARLVTTAAVLGLLVAGCSGSSGSSSSGGKVSIKAGDKSCDVAKTSFSAGEIAFDVQNTGSDTTEVYVYGKGSDGDFDKVVGEVENIAPGTDRDFEVDLAGGSYEVACKPGQSGKGIRTAVTVEGGSDEATAEAAYDREVEVKARDYSFTGLDGLTLAKGAKVELKLENTATDNQHELEVVGPDGKPLGEVGPTDPGEDGEVVLTFSQAGTYTFLCGIGDHEAKGMKKTVTVS